MARDQTVQVLMAGYFSKEAAREDAASVRDGNAELIGLVVVSKDLEGNVSVEEDDQAVKKGALAIGGAGFVVGLFAPPLLAATAIGAALGAGVGKTVQRKVAAGIKEEAQDSIPIGSAGLMVAYPPGSGPVVEAAVKRAITRTIGDRDRLTFGGVEGCARRRTGTDERSLSRTQRGRAAGVWSGRRGSNSRHAAWKAAALPTELLPLGSARSKTLPRPPVRYVSRVAVIGRMNASAM